MKRSELYPSPNLDACAHVLFALLERLKASNFLRSALATQPDLLHLRRAAELALRGNALQLWLCGNKRCGWVGYFRTDQLLYKCELCDSTEGEVLP